MRKALIAVAVATALFAVGAFAASFAVQSEDIASGSDSVDKCAENVDINFDVPELNVDGEWVVTGATATFYELTVGDPSDNCDDFDAQLAVDSGTTASFSGEAVVAAGIVTFDLGDGLLVEDIVEASVVVNGEFITPA